MRKKEPIYVVVARRWGDDQCHAYVVGAATQLSQAKEIAKKEEAHRGGKYAGVVYQCPNGMWNKGSVTEVWRASSMAG